MNAQGMPRVLSEGAEQLKGEMSRMSSIMGALAVSDLVRSTLGPKGMDKILQSQSNNQSVEVTNDGATILRSVVVDNPAAKILIDISRVQDEEIGDGTTSVCVVAGELLREAEKLMMMRVHPQTIIAGWRLAVDSCRQVLERIKVDAGRDSDLFRQQLVKIAQTTLSSKLLTNDRDHFANLAVDAVLRLDKENPDLDLIYILKKPGGSIRDSFLEEGFILDKSIGVGQPKRLENPRILVANTPMDTDKIKIYGAQVKTDSIAKMAEIEAAERAKMVEKCKKIIGHNVNVFINRQLIYDLPEQEFTDAGMCSIEHADFDGIERIAAALGGEIVSTFDHPELVRVGSCKLMEEVIIGEDTLVRFSGVPAGSACTVVLRGASSQVLEEAERSLHDALCVLLTAVKSPYTICGGGSSEMEMALECDKLAKTTPGKKALAIEAYSRALRQIPKIIADNAGYDSVELVAQLQAAHANGEVNMGLDMKNGVIADMTEVGVHEAFRSKLQVIVSASEAAEQILRVDEIVRCAPRQRGGHGH